MKTCSKEKLEYGTKPRFSDHYFFFFITFLLLTFCGCQSRKQPLRTEPTLVPAAPVISPEELLNRGKLELQKFTVPGYREAVNYFEQALKLRPDFLGVYGRLAVAYGLWARERKDLGLDNLEQWVKSFSMPREREKSGRQPITSRLRHSSEIQGIS